MNKNLIKITGTPASIESWNYFKEPFLALIKDGGIWISSDSTKIRRKSDAISLPVHEENLIQIGFTTNELVGTAWLTPIVQNNKCYFEGPFFSNATETAKLATTKPSEEEQQLFVAEFAGSGTTSKSRKDVKVGSTFAVFALKLGKTRVEFFLVDENEFDTLNSKTGRASSRYFQLLDKENVPDAGTILEVVATEDGDLSNTEEYAGPTKVTLKKAGTVSEVKKLKQDSQLTNFAKSLFLRGVASYDDSMEHLKDILSITGALADVHLERLCSQISPTFHVNNIVEKPKKLFVAPNESLIKEVLLKLSRNVNVSLVGEKGTGKNLLLRELSWLFNKKLLVISCSGETTLAELIGSTQLIKQGESVVTKFVPSEMMKGILSGHKLICLDEWNALYPAVAVSLHSILEPDDRSVIIEGTGTIKVPSTVFFAGTRNDNSLGNYNGVSSSINEATLSRWSNIKIKRLASAKDELKAQGISLPDPELHTVCKFWDILRERVYPTNSDAIPISSKFYCSRTLINAVRCFSEDGADISNALLTEFDGLADLADGDMRTEFKSILALC